MLTYTVRTHQTTYSGNWRPSESKGHGRPSPLQPEGGQSIQPVKQPEQPVNTASMLHTRLHARRDFHVDVMNNITHYGLRITRTRHAMFGILAHCRNCACVKARRPVTVVCHAVWDNAKTLFARATPQLLAPPTPSTPMLSHELLNLLVNPMHPRLLQPR